MSATTAMRQRLRRMTQEQTTRHYSDTELDTIIETYPLPDINGESPWMEDSSGDLITNTDWAATYDLNAAAADIWLEKAGRSSEKIDAQEDTGRVVVWKRGSTIAEHAMQMHRIYSARRSAKSTTVRPADDLTFAESDNFTT